ncbi:MAG: ATP-binding protein [Sulfuritalea sp.]|nr:ATP-binding protein [Sulfuritalea sp.]
MYYYARPELAKTLTNSLRGEQLFSDAPNGLFLAAPRRTGKSTFLQNDLKPALDAAGAVVVYVDLWADRKRDPGSLISEVIGKALTQQLGFVARAAKASGLENVSIAGWLKIDASRIGKLDGATLVDALKALRESAEKPVALIIDEAQHALTSEAGEAAMSALKSARDQMNHPDETNLMLVMSGSDRDKLLRLVNTNGAPFYGSTIHKMPELGRDFIEHGAGLIARLRPDLAPVDVEQLWQAFQLFGCRPQFFAGALGEVLNPLNSISGRFEAYVVEAARQRQAADEAQMESAYLALKPLEQAVLWRLLEQGPRFRPYDADALKFYGAKTGARVSAQQAQNAMEALRSQTPSLVWKSARGEYALDEAMMHQWCQKRVAENNWPPIDATPIFEDNQAN